MRILVPLPFDVTCLQHGRNLRIVHLLRELAGKCEITCAIAHEELGEASRKVLPGIRIACASGRLDSHDSASAMLDGSWLMKRAVGFFGFDPILRSWTDQLVDQADVVLGFDLPCVPYIAPLRNKADRRIPRVCDLIDDPWLTYCNTPLIERVTLGSVKNAVAVRVLRRQLLGRMDALIAVAPPDAESLFNATGQPVRVVPNGVEVPLMATGARNDEPLVVFTGAMNFSPNERAAGYLARRIWPRVRRLVPRARLALVGANPSSQVQALADLDGVEVTGRVQDLGAWLRRARVAVAPMLSGSGMKNKVLEACANACPVVATSIAVAGVPTGSANGILVADDPFSFADHVARLLTDSVAADKLGRVAQEMVRDRFTWRRAAETLEATLRICVDASNSRVSPDNRWPAETRCWSSGCALTQKEATHAVS